MMASEMDQILKGSKLLVTVEEALSDVLLVYVESGTKEFRGALLNCRKKDLPFGVNIPRNILRPSVQNVDVATGEDDTSDATTVKPEMSWLSGRHTYTLDPQACDAKLLPSPKKDITSLLRNRNFRPMRLRPPKTYCVRCKKMLEEEKEFIPHDGINFKTCKRKRCEDDTNAAATAEKANPENEHQMKSSPVLKISFSSPSGSDTVMKICPRKDKINGFDLDNRENDLDLLPKIDDVNGLDHSQYRKLKKALKEARMKRKIAEKSSVQTNIALKKIKLKKGPNAQKKINWQPRVMLSKTLNNRGKLKAAPILQEMLEETSSKPKNQDKQIPKLTIQNHKCKIKAKTQSPEPSNKKGTPSPGKKQLKRKSTPKETINQETPGSSQAKEIASPSSHNTEIVDQISLGDGNLLNNGAILWGKIHRFPWWPCKVHTLMETREGTGDIISQYAQVSWLGSATYSNVPCSQLRPFQADFTRYHNKKRKGSYRQAIQQALSEVQAQ